MDHAPYYMACLDLTGRSVLVVGGGPVALEKVEGLLAAGADVTVVAPEIVPELAELEVDVRPARLPRRRSRGEVPRRRRDLDDRRSTGASSTTLRPARSSATSSTYPSSAPSSSRRFIAMSRSPFAVSTGGASPALAQHLRDQIAAVVRPEHAELAHRLRELRPWAKAHFATYDERKAYFAGLVAEELG